MFILRELDTKNLTKFSMGVIIIRWLILPTKITTRYNIIAKAFNIIVEFIYDNIKKLILYYY